jgi:hypothetical protein
LPIPIRVRIPETVESAIPSVSAISAAVNRTEKGKAAAKRSAASSATSPATSTGYSNKDRHWRLAAGERLTVDFVAPLA